MEFTPTLLWSQTYQTIEIQIDLPNISSEILTCENNIFHFECLSSNKKYLIDFELEGEISGNNILSRSDKKIVIHLEKKEEDKWDFLTKKRGIYFTLDALFATTIYYCSRLRTIGVVIGLTH